MIGRQINFYLLGDDRRRLLTAIDEAAGCTLLCRNDRSPYARRAWIDNASKDWAMAYVCHPSVADFVLAAIRSDVADVSELPVIDFIQPTLDGKLLKRGRFWYAPRFLSREVLLPKPKGFVDWADEVFRVARRELAMHGNGDRIGPDATAMAQSGQIQLIT